MREANYAKVSHKKTMLTLGVGTVAAIIVNTVLLLLFAVIITYRNIPMSYIQTIAFVCSGISVFTGGYITSKEFKNRGIVWGLITGGIFFVLSYSAGILSSGNHQKFSIVFLNLLICILAGAVGGIMGVNTKKRKKK